MEAAALCVDDPVRQRYVTLVCFEGYGYLLAYQRPNTLAARLELEESWGGEAALVAAVEEYGKSCDQITLSIYPFPFNSTHSPPPVW